MKARTGPAVVSIAVEVSLVTLFSIRNILGPGTGSEHGYPNFFHEDAGVTNFKGKIPS
jgi:hypothetical protein